MLGRIFMRHLTTKMTTPLISRKGQQPFTVFVEGNIGCGKTTFLKNFSKSDSCILAEPVELWRNLHGANLLGLMYKDPSRWSMTFQSYVLMTMLDLHLQPTDLPFKFMERSVFSARHCFVENLVRSGVMQDADFFVLDEWFKWVFSTVDIDADLIVYLRTSPEVVFERIQARGRKEEDYITLEYLRDLHNLHEDWLNKNTASVCPAPVLIIDADRSLTEMDADIKKCKSIILQRDFEETRKI